MLTQTFYEHLVSSSALSDHINFVVMRHRIITSWASAWDRGSVIGRLASLSNVLRRIGALCRCVVLFLWIWGTTVPISPETPGDASCFHGVNMSVPYPPNDPNQPPVTPYGTVPPPAPPDPFSVPQANPYAPPAPPTNSYAPPPPASPSGFNLPNISASAATNEAKNFFARLVDTSFTTFITPSIVKILYIILMVVSALTWLGVIVSGFTVHPVVGVMAIVFGWIPALLTLIASRVGLEIAIAMIRTAINTSALKKD